MAETTRRLTEPDRQKAPGFRQKARSAGVFLSERPKSLSECHCLVSCRVIVELIAAATTRAGRKIRSRIDDNEYPLGVKVSDERMKTLKIRRDGFHGDWNHTLINRSS